MSLEAISIIIPVLNEAKQLPKLLDIQNAASGVEIIVVDGGSQDETVEIALTKGVKVIQSEAGRAIQMNTGAAIATGDILLFLHADTQLPDQFDRMIRETVSNPATIAGAFELKIASDLPGLRWIERGVNWRSRYLQMPYGDQALFLRRNTFETFKGFPELPIMEDFELVRTLRQHGIISIVPASVITSGRRWQKLGVLRTTLINQLVILAYFLGVSPYRIRQWYRTGLKR
jgi:rSAM/selenodomain-associated transferase 2